MLRLELAACLVGSQVLADPKHKGEVGRPFATLRLDKRISQTPCPPEDDTPQPRLTSEEMEELLLARLTRPSLAEEGCYEPF